MYEGKAVILEAETESFIGAAKKWKIRQFLRLKKKKPAAKTSQPGEILGNPSNSVHGGDCGGGEGGRGGGWRSQVQKNG